MGQNLNKLTELFQSQIEALTNNIHTQHADLKAMHRTMHNLLIDDSIKQNLSRKKLNELETHITCLAQSSISPDTLKEVVSLLDIIAQNSKSTDVTDANSELGELSTLVVKLSQIYFKMQGTDLLCFDICKSITDASDDENLNMELQRQIDVIKKIQQDNGRNMKEIYLQLNHISQTIQGGAAS